MRVNIITTVGDGSCGIGTYTKYLSEEQEKFGHQIVHYYFNQQRKFDSNLLSLPFKLTKNCDIVHIQFDYPFFGKFLGMTGVGIIFFYPFLYILSRVRRCQIFTTMHEIWDFHVPPKLGFFGSIYSFILNYIIVHCSDIIIVLSENAYQIALKQGAPPGKIFKIPHGLKKVSIQDKIQSKIALGLDPEYPIILQFGFVSETKGQDILVKASSLLTTKSTVIIAGTCKNSKDIEYDKSIRAIAPNNVIFRGFTPEKEVALLFNAADLVVLPYRKILQSGVLNLSLSYEIPTITSDLSFFREIHDEYQCILLFRAGDPICLSQAIDNVLQDSNLRNHLKYMINRYVHVNAFSEVASELNRIYIESGVIDAK